MSDRDWSIEGDGGEPLEVYARGLDRRVVIRASGAVVLDADGLAKVIAELTRRLAVLTGATSGEAPTAERRALLVAVATTAKLALDRGSFPEGGLNWPNVIRDMADAVLVLLGALTVTEDAMRDTTAALVKEREEHAATLAELGPPPVVDGRLLGGREATRVFRQELDRTRVDLDITTQQCELWRESRERLLSERDHVRVLVRTALAVLEHVRAAPGGNVEEVRRILDQIAR